MKNYLKDFLLLISVYYASWLLRARGYVFFHCGEYGSKTGRPHYHACIFKYDFPDKVFYTERNGYKLFTSQILQDLWTDPSDGLPYGYCSVGSLTFESAAYVARYILKKVNGKGCGFALCSF